MWGTGYCYILSGLLSADLLTPNHAFSFPSCIKTLIFTLLFPQQSTGGRKTLDIWAPALLMMFSGIFCLPIVSLLSENKVLSFEIRQHFGGLTKNVCGEMRFTPIRRKRWTTPLKTSFVSCFFKSPACHFVPVYTEEHFRLFLHGLKIQPDFSHLCFTEMK